MTFQRHFHLFIAIALYFSTFSAKAFAQNDYVPGMEQFPNINIIHYELQAELKANTPIVKANAVVEFQIVDKGFDYGVFEIDRRARIKSVRAKNGQYLKFNQPENADYVVFSLPWYLKQEKKQRSSLITFVVFPCS